MEEAVEICKLRLFLKLVAQVERVDEIEPLPDIDFNIRAGNTLVGFATLEDVRKAISSEASGQAKIQFDDTLQRIEEKAQDIDQLFQLFRQQQTELGGEVTPDNKQELRKRLSVLEDELNSYLAREYGVDPKKKDAYRKWLMSHKPFHWFIEFYGIIKNGGFEGLIGNPPYVEYKDVRTTYTVRGFETLPTGDLYAFTLERAYQLTSAHGHIGMIVPISMFGTDGFEPLQALSRRSLNPLWVSYFSNRPAQLFDGSQKRLTILLGKRFHSENPRIYTTSYFRWLREERDALLPARVAYVTREACFQVFPASLEKLGSNLEVSTFSRILAVPRQLAGAVVASSKHRLYYTRKFGYFLAFLKFVQRIIEVKSRRKVPPSELKELRLASANSVPATIAALTSSTFFWFWNVLSDCRNLNRRDLLAFRIDPEEISAKLSSDLTALANDYLSKLEQTSRTMLKSGLEIQTFDYGACKPTIDRIDRVLAQHYGFTDEELDFIINYDIKYRMGREQEGAEEALND
jgi:hypothetical protein